MQCTVKPTVNCSGWQSSARYIFYHLSISISLSLSLSPFFSTDSRKLSDCGIKNGDTLYLAQKSPPTPPPPPSPLTRPLPSWSQCSQFHSRTQAYLSQHFTEDEAEQIVTTMERVYIALLVLHTLQTCSIVHTLYPFHGGPSHLLPSHFYSTYIHT